MTVSRPIRKLEKTARLLCIYEFERLFIAAPFSFIFLCTPRHSRESENLPALSAAVIPSFQTFTNSTMRNDKKSEYLL
jgi:hypothetical protein